MPHPVIFRLIQHLYVQRLRRITQLGLTNYVYPGAMHTRFHHALGAMHLMQQAVEVLRSKGQEITEEEEVAVLIGILLHDVGHGPFSHTLEHCLIQNISHEYLSLCIMDALNKEFDGELDLAICIFKNEYHKKFLHQLIAGQLDMDRLDYLKRDSFFTGVYEGVIGSDRIIKMLNVQDDRLVVEAKAIYSIEKFLVARRLMYWQVYLHKTVICAEETLVSIFRRVKDLAKKDVALFATPSLGFFIYNDVSGSDFVDNRPGLHHFARLDDYDVMAAVKVWCTHNDVVLSTLCKSLIERKLFKVELTKEPIQPEKLGQLKEAVIAYYSLEDPGMADYLVFHGSTGNRAYNPEETNINILYKDGSIKDIVQASDQLNLPLLSKSVIKNYLCYPKRFTGL